MTKRIKTIRRQVQELKRSMGDKRYGRTLAYYIALGRLVRYTYSRRDESGKE